jgi:alpha-amylase
MAASIGSGDLLRNPASTNDGLPSMNGAGLRIHVVRPVASSHPSSRKKGSGMKTLASVLVAACLTTMAARAQDISPVAVEAAPSALPKGWNKSANFMEIFVRSYQDSNGDGVGDLKGLISRLDYLQELGITGLWLMPVGPSEDGDHGYAQADYRSVNPQFGSLADFDELVREAHKRGIGIILDFVINHSASTNPIFEDAAKSESSRFRSWYLFRKEDPHWSGFGTDPWRKNSKGPGYYYGVFSTEMPDWNLRNPEVVDYIEGSMRFWMNRGVDGFRLDAVTMLFEDGPKSFYNNPRNAKFTAELKAVVEKYDNRLMMCEADKGADLYAQSCGNAFAFGSQQQIRKSVLDGRASQGLIDQLKSPLRAHMPLTLQTHDAYVGDRLINQFGVNGFGNYVTAATVAILGSDVSFSYYGEEIGESNNGKGDDPGLRGPMSWTADQRTAGFTTGKPYRDVAINVASNNVEAQLRDPGSLYHMYQALYRARNKFPDLGSGSFELLSGVGDSTLIFKRGPLFVAINLAEQPSAVRVAASPNASYADVLALPGVSFAPVSADAAGSLGFTIPAKRAVVLKAQ